MIGVVELRLRDLKIIYYGLLHFVASTNQEFGHLAEQGNYNSACGRDVQGSLAEIMAATLEEEFGFVPESYTEKAPIGFAAALTDGRSS